MRTIDQLTLNDNNTMFHPMMGNSYQLNDTGREIMLLLKENKSKEEIIEMLSLEYGIPKSELFIDVSDFLSKVKIYGLLS